MYFLEVLKILILFPFAIIYRFVIDLRNFFYDFKIIKSTEFNIPIISVGNISIGGTGKTPHTEMIINFLCKQYKVAVISRGYKRKTKGFRIVNKNDNYQLTGDEPLQIKQKFDDVIVAVCENRKIGITKLIKIHPEVEVIILDDAFQHRRIKPGLSILLINYNKPIKDDYILPIGMLREPVHNSSRADIIIYTKCPEKITPIERRIIQQDIKLKPYQHLFFSKIVYEEIIPLFKEYKDITIQDLKQLKVLLFTGIANSEHLANYIEKHASEILHLKFSDHHNFTQKDYHKILENFNKILGNKILLTTEKDAIRLKVDEKFPEELKSFLFCIKISVKIITEKEEETIFKNKIYEYVGKNKRNNRFSVK